jgi:flagellar protein FlgJ
MKHTIYGLLLTLFIGSHLSTTAIAASRTPNGPFESIHFEPSLALFEKKVIRFQTPAEFVETLLPFSKKAGKELGIDPKLILAQAALETNWGRSIPKHKDGSSSFNMFGLTGQSQLGNSVKLRTKEFKGNKPYHRFASFRAYMSFSECFSDYVRILSTERYQRKIQDAKTAHEVARGIQRAGFATDPNYARKLMKAYHHPAIKNA